MVSNESIINLLNQILELELAGVVRYTHYSFMVFGYNRIPIVQWLREQATESLQHAQRAGELITYLGGHPSLQIASLLDKHSTHIREILRESLAHEEMGLNKYKELLTALEKSQENAAEPIKGLIMLEEYARQMIYLEEMHLSEVIKMLQQPE